MTKEEQLDMAIETLRFYANETGHCWFAGGCEGDGYSHDDLMGTMAKDVLKKIIGIRPFEKEEK